MNINLIIAGNLKRLRNERNLSLSQLARLSDISKAMISQIEKGNANPTINTIWKIAGGLNVPYTSLLERRQQSAFIIKKSDIVSQTANDEQYRLYCYYSSTPHRNFEFFQMELDEGCRYSSIGHPEKAEKYIMILKGRLTLEVNDKIFILNVNDSITFSAATEHVYFNSGKGILKACIINFYPVQV